MLWDSALCFFQMSGVRGDSIERNLRNRALILVPWKRMPTVMSQESESEGTFDWPDMEFVKNFTQPDFQAKNFTPQKRVNCDIFLANQQRKCIKY